MRTGRRQERRTRGGRGRRGTRGFTLLETLAAMSIFAIASTGAGAMALQSMRHLAANRHASHAAMLAQEEMETQRGFDYANMTSRSQTKTMANQEYSVGTVVSPDDPDVNMTRIVVTVSWTGPEGNKAYAVESIFTAPAA